MARKQHEKSRSSSPESAAELESASKKRKAEHPPEPPTDGQMPTEPATPPLSPSSPPSSKKRKVSVPEIEEIEIDPNAPEPPSKKALRRAKKGKTKAVASGEVGAAAGVVAEEAKAQEVGEDAANATTKRSSSKHGVWIGNLPWSASAATLKQFLVEHAGITEEEITRLHMPAPSKSSSTTAWSQSQSKALNKGFAYVDFTTAEAVQKVIGLSESLLGGRRVLIKDAGSFEGRPDPAASAEDGVAVATTNGKKPPNKRVFVGNLAFDAIREEVREHFEQAGEVADVFLATFEDSGKCKGYGWVTFAELESAEAAVRGWIEKEVEREGEEEEEEEEEDDDDDDVEETATKHKSDIAKESDMSDSDHEKEATEDTEISDDDESGSGDSEKPKSDDPDHEQNGDQSTKPVKPTTSSSYQSQSTPQTKTKPKRTKPKPRKWFINRLKGRQLRVEYAEDAAVRYKKRFGKGSKTKIQSEEDDGAVGVDSGEQNDGTLANGENGHGHGHAERHRKKDDANGRANGRAAGGGGREERKGREKGKGASGLGHGQHDARTAQRLTGAIVEAKGKKTKFE